MANKITHHDTSRIALHSVAPQVSREIVDDLKYLSSFTEDDINVDYVAQSHVPIYETSKIYARDRLFPDNIVRTYSNNLNSSESVYSSSSALSVPELSETSRSTLSSGESSTEALFLDEGGSRVLADSETQPRRYYRPTLHNNPRRERSTKYSSDGSVQSHLKNKPNFVNHAGEHSFVSHGDGVTVRGSAGGRRGPLTLQQSTEAALMRRLGACKECKLRKIKCSPLHHESSRYVHPEVLARGTLGEELLVENAEQRGKDSDNFEDYRHDYVGVESPYGNFSKSSRYNSQRVPENFPERCRDGANSTNCTTLGRASITCGDVVSTSMSFSTSVPAYESNSPSLFEADSVDSDGNESTDGEQDDEESARPPSMIEEAQFLHLLDLMQPFLLKLPMEVAWQVFNRVESLFNSWSESETVAQHTHGPSSHNPSASASLQSQSKPSSNQSTNPTTISSGKRFLDSTNSSFKKGNGDERPNKRPKRTPISHDGSNAGTLWACPFYQREPHIYCVRTQYGDWRKCAKSPGFQDPHRVKEHLKECHYPPYCERCFTYYDNESLLTSHRREPSGCVCKPEQAVHGLTMAQRELLKPRHGRNKSHEERWNYIYRICFPNDMVVPNGHYIHYSQDMALLRRDFMEVLARPIPHTQDQIMQLMQDLEGLFTNRPSPAGRPSDPLMHLIPASPETSTQTRFLSDPDPVWSGPIQQENSPLRMSNNMMSTSMTMSAPPVPYTYGNPQTAPGNGMTTSSTVPQLPLNGDDNITPEMRAHLRTFNRDATMTSPSQDVRDPSASQPSGSIPPPSQIYPPNFIPGADEDTFDPGLGNFAPYLNTAETPYDDLYADVDFGTDPTSDNVGFGSTTLDNSKTF